MKWQPTPVFLPGKSHGQRSLAGYISAPSPFSPVPSCPLPSSKPRTFGPFQQQPVPWLDQGLGRRTGQLPPLPGQTRGRSTRRWLDGGHFKHTEGLSVWHPSFAQGCYLSLGSISYSLWASLASSLSLVLDPSSLKQYGSLGTSSAPWRTPIAAAHLPQSPPPP